MARPLRIEFEGAWYHVMNRGVGRRGVFKTDEHRRYFVSLLAETTERFNAEWHAYCLMTNHYHLMLHTPEGNLQRIMRHVNGVYTQYFNRTQGRDGPLFRGRYKAIVVDAEAYWLQLSRYIHRNPVEARIVSKLEDYRWSSYRAYIGKDPRPSWLNCDYVLKSVASRNARARYKAYVAEGVDAEIQAFYGQRKLSPILGGKAFRERLPLKGNELEVPELRAHRRKPSPEHIAETVCRHIGVDPATVWAPARSRGVSNPARAIALYLCQQEADMRLADIATYFGLKSYTSAGSSIRHFRRLLGEDRGLAEVVERVRNELRR